MARKMRDSGVEWIGEVPERWEFLRNKWCFSCSKSIVGKASETTQLLSLTTSGVKCKGKEVIGGKLPESFDTYQEVSQNDLILCLFDMDCSAVFSGLSRFDGMISPAYKVMKCKRCIEPKYADYWFDFVGSQRFFKPYAKNIRYSLTFDEFADLMMIVPPLPEQRRIADYLDEKCAAIDGAVCELKRGIEDCKAWKKAIIFEAVTGKANVLAASACAKATADKKNAKVAKRQMRDSGIPWIGEIPEGWEVKPLRRLGRLANGISKGGEYFGKGFPFVSYSDVYKNDAIPTQVKGLVEANDQERERYSVKRGDVFFTRTSETVDEIGIAAACLKDIQDSTFAGFLIRFRPMTDELLPEFSKYYFRNKLVSEYFAKELVMVTRASLGQELLKSLPVFIPPMKEQQAIADYLDEKCAAIDALVAEKEKLIADLEAYKKSLIFELVTGKREVA